MVLRPAFFDGENEYAAEGRAVSRKPGPAGLWVLLDEDDRSLNDAGFAVTMVASLFLDAPGTYHNMACGFAFADGHSEIHKWKDPRTQIKGNSFSATLFDPISQDVTWIQERTSAKP